MGENEKVCYVCGEVQLPEVVKADFNDNDNRQSVINFEKDEDFVVPMASNEDKRVEFESRVPYTDDDLAEPYYEMDEKRERAQKQRSKKGIIIAVVCVLAAAIIGAICFCMFNGVFEPKKEIDNKMTIYFDRPNADIDLIASDGTTYKWSNDVCVSYVIDKKEKTKDCTPCEDHETLWEVTLPTKAKSIYFFENDEEKVRTQVLPGFDDEMVYYVSQESFNAQNQLPLGQCERSAFEGIGINYAETAETTESTETEETTQSASSSENTEETTKTEETSTKDENDTRKTVDNGDYTVDLPENWQSGVTAVKGPNYTTYYEDYNYKMYNMGKMATIYVFEAKDEEADNLTGVKKILYTKDKSKKIVITTPTDIQFDETDENAQKNYVAKNKDLSSFLDSVTAK